MHFRARFIAALIVSLSAAVYVRLSIGEEPVRNDISVMQAEPTVLDEKQWSGLPDFLKGATVFKPSMGNVLDLKAKQDGQVVIAASWAHDGEPSDEWYKGRTMLPELVDDGWEPIGRVVQKGKGEHRILRKTLHAGDHLQFHTRKINPPIAFLVAPTQANTLAATPTVPFTSAEIAAVKPPSQRSAARVGKGVALAAFEPIPDFGFFERGILFRELVRQAVLLAAREELGQPTRDDTLRERSSDGDAAGQHPLDIVVEVNRDGRVNVTLFRFAEDKHDVLWDKHFPLQGDDMLLALITESERLSRVELPDALKKAGFDGDANPVTTNIEQDRKNNLLREMHPIAQLDAARQLHALLHTQGESPAALADLARAYANLSVLTEHLWFPGHKVFKARALLYAERGVRRWPDSQASLAGRAYARALVGMHEAALEDLAQLKMDGTSSKSPEASEHRLLTAFCRFELDTLSKNDLHVNHRQLLQILELAAVERYSGTAVTLAAADEVLALIPDSDRAIDAIYETRRLGTRGGSAELGLKSTPEGLYGRLQKISALPPKVVDQMKTTKSKTGRAERNQRLELIRALRREGELGQDKGEPSWQSLASWIEEVAFLQSARQLEFLATGLSVPLDDTREELEGLLVEHPYRGFIDTMCDDTNVRRERLTAFAKIAGTDTGLNETFMWTRLTYNGFNQGRNLYNLAYHHQDWVYRDLLTTTRSAQPELRPHFAELLRRASPHSPFTVATTIEYDWPYASSRAGDWEKRYVDSPQVQASLGKEYLKQEKYADSVRCLKRAVAALPEYESYKALAEAWLKQGNEKEWQATWDDFLQQPDFGLEQARARVAVAEHFMLDGKFQDALPYAEEAAQTYSEWGLVCAADCLTGLKRWPEAERYMQAAGRRYPDSSTGWYFWCQRTGHGKLAEARKEVQAVTANPKQGTPPANRALFFALEGDKKQALKIYQEALARQGDWLMAWRAAVLADELKEVKIRDDMLKIVIRVASMIERPKPLQVDFARLAQQALADKSKFATFAQDVKDLMKKIDDPRERGSAAYFAGKLLLQHENGEGQQLVEEAAKLPFNGLSTTAAAAEVRTQTAARIGAKR